MRKMLLALLVGVAALVPTSAPASPARDCVSTFNGPRPLPGAGCLRYRSRPVTLADLTEVATAWQVPADATVMVVRSDLRPGPWVVVTFRWS